MLPRKLFHKMFHLQQQECGGYPSGGKIGFRNNDIDGRLPVADRVIHQLVIGRRTPSVCGAAACCSRAAGETKPQGHPGCLRQRPPASPPAESTGSTPRSESIWPGTAYTFRPCSMAWLAVISAPLPNPASTTAPPSPIPPRSGSALGRLRIGGHLHREFRDDRTRPGDLLRQ